MTQGYLQLYELAFFYPAAFGYTLRYNSAGFMIIVIFLLDLQNNAVVSCPKLGIILRPVDQVYHFQSPVQQENNSGYYKGQHHNTGNYSRNFPGFF